MKLTGQTVLITGATSGIGLHLATRLHALQNKVVVCGRRRDQLDALAAQHPGLETRVCDVSDAAQREDLARWAVATYPGLNVVVNNAGLMQLIDLTRAVDLTRVTTEVTTNLVAPIHLTGLFVEHLRRQPTAAVVNVTSGLAFTPLATVPVYCATKAALHSFSLSLRHQLRATSVRVFELVPPAVDTNLGHADGYDRSQDHAMPVEDFVTAALRALEQDVYEAAIGSADGLHQQREALFGLLNP